MNENDLGKALLRNENPLDIHALTQRVLRRDRRRVWLLGVGCVIAWMLVIALPWATIMPMMAKIAEVQWGLHGHAPGPGTPHESATELLMILKKGTMATFFLSLATMLCAALCTVSLVILSRRATLRQVNARLGEISAQLKILTDAAK